MNDLHSGIVSIDAAKAQIDDHFLGLAPNIFEQDAGLFQLRREKVTVVGIAGKGPWVIPPFLAAVRSRVG